jgi:hypothetical protein
MDATLDTGGWLALTRQGLSPCKIRQASLGAITMKLSRARHRSLEKYAALSGIGLSDWLGAPTQRSADHKLAKTKTQREHCKNSLDDRRLLISLPAKGDPTIHEHDRDN